MPKCRACRSPFMRVRPLQAACSPACALVVARAKREKAAAREKAAERKKDRARRERLKTRSDWMAEAQAAVNRYVRLRDIRAGHGCVTCGTPFGAIVRGGNWDAGHYRSRGSAPHLRFDCRNIALQCSRCNRYRGGMAVEFRASLIARIGQAAVESLEEDQTTRRHSIDYLRRLRDIFRRRARRFGRRVA